MNKEEKWITLPLGKCFLCPGTLDLEAHVTTNAFQCACGNRNLVSLSKILNRDTDLNPFDFRENYNRAVRWINHNFP